MIQPGLFYFRLCFASYSDIGLYLRALDGSLRTDYRLEITQVRHRSSNPAHRRTLVPTKPPKVLEG